MERTAASFLPLATTTVAAGFAPSLYRHWIANPKARHLFWWFIGVVAYGLGTFAESLTTVFSWHEPAFRLWYITGALMGGVFLALGTVHLMLRPGTARRHTRFVLTFVGAASTLALLSPVDGGTAEAYRLSADVLDWAWIRGFSPLINTYAFIYLVGGAALSALRYWRSRSGSGHRVAGNAAIAVGAILPGIGGMYARLGHVEVLYVTELLGLVLIWAGYTMFRGDRTTSIHATQRPAAGRSTL